MGSGGRGQGDITKKGKPICNGKMGHVEGLITFFIIGAKDVSRWKFLILICKGEL